MSFQFEVSTENKIAKKNVWPNSLHAEINHISTFIVLLVCGHRREQDRLRFAWLKSQFACECGPFVRVPISCPLNELAFRVRPFDRNIERCFEITNRVKIGRFAIWDDRQHKWMHSLRGPWTYLQTD